MDLSIEPPYHFLQQLSDAVAETVNSVVYDIVDEAVTNTMARPMIGPVGLQAFPVYRAPGQIPFAGRTIPDECLARMVERVEEGGGATIEILAVEFGYPPSLVRRELASYYHRFELWCLQLARLHQRLA